MVVKIEFETMYYNQKQCEQFYAIFKNCAQAFGCYYMGYIHEDLISKIRYGFTTKPDWQNEYIGKNLINNCHLWNEVSKYFVNTHEHHFILPWSMIKPTSSTQKDIILYREELNIGQDGISFCTRTNTSREYLYFAPEKNENRFLALVSKSMTLVKQSAFSMRKISSHKVSPHTSQQSIITEI